MGRIFNILKKYGLWAWYGFLILLVIYVLVVGLANVADYKIDFLSINPHEQDHVIPIYLYYPSTYPGMPLPIVESENNTPIVGSPDASIEIFLKCNGLLSEGKNVDISGFGLVNPKGEEEFARIGNQTINGAVIRQYIAVGGFEGDQTVYNYSKYTLQVPGGRFFLDLINQTDPNEVFTHEPPSPENFVSQQTVNWSIQGDYYPFITFFFENGTESTITYPDYKIHVVGSDVELQEKYSKITSALTIVLAVFTFVTTVCYLQDKLAILFNPTKNANGENDKPSDDNESPTAQQQVSEKVPAPHKGKKGR